MAVLLSESLLTSRGAPLAVPDENDHGAWILICNAFGLVVVLCSLAIRVYLRVKVSPPYGADDHTLTGATAVTIIQAGLVFAQVKAGFGKSVDLLDDGQLSRIQELGYAADILFIAGLYASKCCVVLFFQRLSPSRTSATVSWIVLSICIIFATASILMLSLRCDLARPWLQYDTSCIGLGARWKAVAAFDFASEIALFAMSIQLVWGLQTKLSKKGTVVFAFGLRLLVILIAALRLRYVERQLQSDDPTLIGATAAVLTQTELFYAVTAATIPCLRPFLSAFVTHYGAMQGDTTIVGGSYIGSTRPKDTKSSGNSFALRSLDSAKRAAGRNDKKPNHLTSRELPEMSPGTLRPDQFSNRISAGHPKGQRAGHDTSSVASDESTRGMIIKKEVAWQVDSQSWRSKSHEQQVEQVRER